MNIYHHFKPSYLGYFSSSCPPLALLLSLFWDETAKSENKRLFCQLVIVSYVIYILYLVVVEEVHEDLHDAREDQHAGAGDQEVVDVVK